MTNSKSQHFNIEILFEDDDVVVVNKPAGILVHPDGKSEKPAITDWVHVRYPQLVGVGEPMVVEGTMVDRPGIVHRLDEDTSGALLITKTPKAFEFFKRQFMDRAIKKEYHAFVWEHFKETTGSVDAPIGRSPSDFRRRLAGRGVRGEVREAVTDWKVAKQFIDERGEKFSFMHLFPHTGRTHQLRVHMKYLQRPIVSDHLYAPTKPDALGFTRLALHAYAITFHTYSGEKIRVEASYPADFQAALAKYVKP